MRAPPPSLQFWGNARAGEDEAACPAQRSWKAECDSSARGASSLPAPPACAHARQPLQIKAAVHYRVTGHVGREGGWQQFWGREVHATGWILHLLKLMGILPLASMGLGSGPAWAGAVWCLQAKG